MVSDYEERIVYLRWSIKNALERGYSIPAIRQSLINAGYEQKEVELASQNLGPLPLHSPFQVSASKVNQVKPLPTSLPASQDKQTTRQVSQPLSSQNQTTPNTNINIILPDYSIPKENNEHQFRGIIIFLIILASMMIIGAAIIGLYWDRLDVLRGYWNSVFGYLWKI
ncbi:MAG: hypothetical protein WCP89_01765 [archaeon]